MVISERKLRKFIRSVIREMRDASFDNSEYIISKLKGGYLAHGTPNENLSSFDEKFIKGGCRGEYGYGFYFTDALYKCLEYGSNIYFTPKNIYNFFELDGKGNFKNLMQDDGDIRMQIYKCEQGLDNARNIREYDYYTQELEKLKEKYKHRDEGILGLIEKGIRDNEGYSDENIYKSVLGNLPSDMAQQVSKLLMSYGYDGVHCGNQYCIFNTQKLNSNIVE